MFDPLVYPATSFADGTFSTDLSGIFHDGFYPYLGLTSATNGVGQNGEFIRFSKPVTLKSLSIGKCFFCYDSHPATFTVKLYNAAAGLVDSRSVAASSTLQELTFEDKGITKVEFTFAGDDGTNPYGDGRRVAFYEVRDVFYSLSAPEPAAWTMMIGGFGLTGAALRRRRARAA